MNNYYYLDVLLLVLRLAVITFVNFTRNPPYIISCNITYRFIHSEFPKDQEREVTPAFFKNHIVRCIDKIFGETAAAIPLDILKYNPSTKEAILRVHKEQYVRVRSSLTLCGDYEGIPCVYRIRKATPMLLSLLGDSRTYNH